jgi:C4-type Zn-finger protein
MPAPIKSKGDTEMKCPKCQSEMKLREFEDEALDGCLIGRLVWECPCGHRIYDQEDDFEEDDECDT